MRGAGTPRQNARADVHFAGAGILLKEEDLLLLQDRGVAVDAVAKGLSREVVSGGVAQAEAPGQRLNTSGINAEKFNVNGAARTQGR